MGQLPNRGTPVTGCQGVEKVEKEEKEGTTTEHDN